MHTRDQANSIQLLLDYKKAADALGLTEQALRDLVWKNKDPVVTEIGTVSYTHLTLPTNREV